MIYVIHIFNNTHLDKTNPNYILDLINILCFYFYLNTVELPWTKCKTYNWNMQTSLLSTYRHWSCCSSVSKHFATNILINMSHEIENLIWIELNKKLQVNELFSFRWYSNSFQIMFRWWKEVTFLRVEMSNQSRYLYNWKPLN